MCLFFNQLPSTMVDTSPTVSLHHLHMQLVRICKIYMYQYAVVYYVFLFIGYRHCPCISHPRDLTLFLIWYKGRNTLGNFVATTVQQSCRQQSHSVSWGNHICCVQHVAQNRPAVCTLQLCCHETSKACCLLHATIFLWHTGWFVACNCCVQQSCLVYPRINIVCMFVLSYECMFYWIVCWF